MSDPPPLCPGCRRTDRVIDLMPEWRPRDDPWGFAGHWCERCMAWLSALDRTPDPEPEAGELNREPREQEHGKAVPFGA